MSPEQVDEFCERGILFLVLGALAFGSLALGGTHAEFFAVMVALGIAALWLWLVRFWRASKPTLCWPPMAWAVLAFLGYAALRTPYAAVEYTAQGELLLVALCGMFFFVVVNNLNRAHSANWVAGMLLTVAAFSSMYAIFQVLTKSTQVWNYVRWEGYRGRGSGTYICPNHLAGWLELALPLGLAYLLMGRLHHIMRILTGYAVIVIGAGLLATESRGAWVATTLALLGFFAVLLAQRGQRVPALLVLICMVGAGGWAVAQSQTSSERVQKLFDPNRLNDAREHLWPAAIKIWHANFWWGAGPGHYDHLFRLYRDTAVQARPDRVHNDYLNTLADWGLVGAVLVALALVVLFWGVVRVWPHVQRDGDAFRARQSNRFAFVLGASTSLVALLIHSVVDFNFHIPANALAAVTLMALLAAHWRYATSQVHVPLGLAGRVAITVLGLGVAVWLGRTATARGIENRLLVRSQDPQGTASRQLELLRQAHAVEPGNAETCFMIGEVLRVTAWDRPAGYEQLATEAMQWFERAWRLNPYDGYSRLRYGMCLDLLGKPQQATGYILKALELDPNGTFTLTHVGWHYCQLEDWAKAREYLRRASTMPTLDPTMNDIFLRLAEERLAEQQRR
ncbi:MAG: hypothetical protein EBS05_05360 [Proteobacteria bacterium]|nr:hypothetical protein [Pseudomonadota bacterium]